MISILEKRENFSNFNASMCRVKIFLLSTTSRDKNAFFSIFLLPNGSQITSNKRIWPTLPWKLLKRKEKFFFYEFHPISRIYFPMRWCDILKMTRRTCDFHTRTRFFFSFFSVVMSGVKSFPLMLLLQQISKNNNKEWERKVADFPFPIFLLLR